MPQLLWCHLVCRLDCPVGICRGLRRLACKGKRSPFSTTWTQRKLPSIQLQETSFSDSYWARLLFKFERKPWFLRQTNCQKDHPSPQPQCHCEQQCVYCQLHRKVNRSWCRTGKESQNCRSALCCETLSTADLPHHTEESSKHYRPSYKWLSR